MAAQASTSRQGRTPRAPKQIKLLLCAELVLGRSPGPGGVSLQSAKFQSMISRKHASIKYLSDSSQWIIKDLHSTNGVHVNEKQIPSNVATPINHGDLIRFGLNTDSNELTYIFRNVNKEPPVLIRESSKNTPQCVVRLQRPIKRPRSPEQSELNTQDSVPESTTQVPTPILGGPVEKHSNNAVSTHSVGESLSSPSILSTEEVLETPPCKRAFTIDSLFDTSKSDTTVEMEEAIFGKTPPLTPRARAVLMGMNLSPIEIQVQIARDEVEKEKNKIESKYEVLKNELAAKNRQLKAKKEKNAKVSQAVEQEFICAICQEMFVRSLTLSCSHSFCEWCLKQWMIKRGIPECPVCRTVSLQKPVRSIAIDNVISRHVANLSRKQRLLRKKVEKQHLVSLGLAPPPSQEESSDASLSSGGPSSLGSESDPIVLDSPERVLSDDDDDVQIQS